MEEFQTHFLDQLDSPARFGAQTTPRRSGSNPLNSGSKPRSSSGTSRNSPKRALLLPTTESWAIEGRDVSVQFLRHPRAVRYRLTLKRDGTVRCTIPHHGSYVGAQRFVERSQDWIALRIEEASLTRRLDEDWHSGSLIWWRGEQQLLQLDRATRRLRLGTFDLTDALPPEILARSGSNRISLRTHIESHFWEIAREKLPSRTHALAENHGIRIENVTVRNQRTRWGSCSVRGVISLNWRLLQLPPWVSDYVILHELAHRRVMNHSRTYWAEVARICPGFQRAEDWLQRHGREIL